MKANCFQEIHSPVTVLLESVVDDAVNDDQDEQIENNE